MKAWSETSELFSGFVLSALHWMDANKYGLNFAKPFNSLYDSFPIVLQIE